MTVTVLLSHSENLLYFQPLELPPWVFESVGKSPSPEDWGGSEESLRGSAAAASGVCLCLH